MASTLVKSLLGLAAVAPLAAALTPGLTLEYSVDRATQGIFFSADGRAFLSQRYSLTDAPQMVELLADNTTVLYPDAAWNSYTANTSTADLDSVFISIDGARIGPDDRLWVVDSGNGNKLVGVNLTTNSVDKLYKFNNVTDVASLDDVRFSGSGEVAYLSDTTGALVVLNLTSGDSIRVLVGATGAVATFPMQYNHTFVPGYGNQATLAVGLDQIEVSPDGSILYFQACNGGLYSIETSYVDASLTNSTLAASLSAYVTPFAWTPSTGGSTIDGDGNLYFSDTNLLAIWKVTPEGYGSYLLQDDSLVWTDLMWVTPDKKLWLPASQMRPGADGLMAAGPNNIFSFPIDAGPSLIDHA